MHLFCQLQQFQQLGYFYASRDLGNKLFTDLIFIYYLHIIPSRHLPHDGLNISTVKPEQPVFPCQRFFHIRMTYQRQVSTPVVLHLLAGLKEQCFIFIRYFYFAFRQSCFYSAFVIVCIYIEVGSQHFDRLFTAFYFKGHCGIFSYLKVYFTRNRYISFPA